MQVRARHHAELATDAERTSGSEPGKADNRRLLRGVPTAIALATVALGVIDVLDALAPERSARLHDLTKVVPLGVAQGASAATVVAGVLLIMLGLSLRRRKRRAWRAALALTLLTAGLHDRATPPDQAIEFHNALVEQGVASDVAVYPQEGHGVHYFPALFDVCTRAVTWFERHMPVRR